MIPVTLRLKNFLSYGDNLPPLDFTNITLACLTGPNGHGKSSLLDAITWALWGQARKVASATVPDPHLLKLGQSQMSVELVFDVGRERFKVYREYLRSGKSHRSVLEILVWDESAERYHSLTESSKKQTQAKICQLIGLDYQTFINSAFIIQGKADEFTRKTARERKTVLANILNLDYYERLAVLAKTKAREAGSRIEILEKQNVLTDDEERFLASWAGRSQELKGKKGEIAGLIAAAEKRLSGRQAQIAQHDLKAKESQRLEKLISRARAEKDSLELELKSVQRELAEQEKLLAQETGIRERLVELETLKIKINEWELKRKEFSELKEERHRTEILLNRKVTEKEKALALLNSKITQGRERLTEISASLSDQERLEARLRTYEETVGQERALSETGKEWQRHNAALTELRQKAALEEQAVLSRRENLQKEAARLKISDQSVLQLKEQKERRAIKLEESRKSEERLQELTGRLNSLVSNLEAKKQQKKEFRSLLADLNEKSASLKKIDHPVCPLCESELPESRQAALIKKLDNEISALRKRGEELAEEIEQGARQIKRWRQDIIINERETAFLRKQTEAVQVAIISQEKKHEEALNRIKQITGELKLLDRSLRTSDFLSFPREKITELTERLRELNYSPENHEKLRSFLSKEADIVGRVRSLRELEKEQKLLIKRVDGYLADKNELSLDMENRGYLAAELEIMAELDRKISELNFSDSEYDKLKKRLAGLEQAPIKLAQLNQAKKRKPELDRRRAAISVKLRANESDLLKNSERFKALEAELSKVDFNPGQIAELKAEVGELRRQRENLIAEIAQGDRELELIKVKERESKLIREKTAELREEQRLYNVLAVALGKDGIQALIIENSLPELELTANDILSRLTQGRTQLRFLSRKDLKSGESRETLEIIISDEQGPRNYELFSGGEAFRINFAIRIAISKLLAHRAGAPLKLLIIDEGFGTQDEEGLRYLLDAIRHISADFEKLIVVTHLQELQAVFPVRIEVSKDPETGSSFRVVS